MAEEFIQVERELLIERRGPLEENTRIQFLYLRVAGLFSLLVGVFSCFWVFTSLRINSEKNIKREQALIDAQEDAKKADKAKSRFLAIISHEIRTPMNGILSSANILEEFRDEKEKAELIKIIQKSGEMLINILNDILDYSKMESGKLKIEESPFCIKEALSDTILIFESEIHNNNLSIETQLTSELPHFFSDSTRIKQLFSNLISNAVKFSESEIKINLSGQKDKDNIWNIQFSVQDNGVGIK